MCGAGSAKILYGGKLAFIIVQKCHAREKKVFYSIQKLKSAELVCQKNFYYRKHISYWHIKCGNLVFEKIAQYMQNIQLEELSI